MERIFEVAIIGAPGALVVAGIIYLVVRRIFQVTANNQFSEREYARYKDRYTLHKDEIIQEQKAASDLAVTALRAAIVLNGAASAAVLAFLSRVLEDNRFASLANAFVDVLALLLAGTICAVLATAFGYLRLYFGTASWQWWAVNEAHHKPSMRAGNGSQGVAFMLVVMSYIFFGAAMVDTIDALGA